MMDAMTPDEEIAYCERRATLAWQASRLTSDPAEASECREVARGWRSVAFGLRSQRQGRARRAAAALVAELMPAEMLAKGEVRHG